MSEHDLKDEELDDARGEALPDRELMTILPMNPLEPELIHLHPPVEQEDPGFVQLDPPVEQAGGPGEDV
jgi:hypothetical protein